jgi:hypothetical protein
MCGTKSIRFRSVGSVADMTARELRMRTQRNECVSGGIAAGSLAAPAILACRMAGTGRLGGTVSMA